MRRRSVRREREKEEEESSARRLRMRIHATTWIHGRRYDLFSAMCASSEKSTVCTIAPFDGHTETATQRQTEFTELRIIMPVAKDPGTTLDLQYSGIADLAVASNDSEFPLSDLAAARIRPTELLVSGMGLKTSIEPPPPPPLPLLPPVKPRFFAVVEHRWW